MRGRYKPGRPPARAEPWKPDPFTRLTEVSASVKEAHMALFAIGKEIGVSVGRVLGYDKQRDIFRVLGKRRKTMRVVEVDVPGELVAQTVLAARVLGLHGLPSSA